MDSFTAIGSRAVRETLLLRSSKLSEDELFRRFRTLIEDLDEILTGAEAKCAMGNWLDVVEPPDLELGEVLVDPGAGAVTRLRVALEVSEQLVPVTRKLLQAAERHARRQMARTAAVAS